MNYVISIVTPEALPRLEELTEELGLPLNVTLHGHGTAIQSMLDFLGIESNEKRVMLSAATEDKTKALIAGQRERLHLGVPGHGIVIAVPMKSVGGGKTMEFLKGNEAGTGKYTPELNFAYELIVIIGSRCPGRYGAPWQGHRRRAGEEILQHHHCRGKGSVPHCGQNGGEDGDHAVHPGEGRAGHPGQGHCLLPAHHGGGGVRVLPK